MEFGQIRQLREDVLKERVADLNSNPPFGQPFEAHMLERTTCFHFILLWDFWDKSVADATTLLPSLLAPSVSALYYVLSGQHIFSAASRIASSRAKEHLPIPRCLSFQDGGKVYGNGNML